MWGQERITLVKSEKGVSGIYPVVRKEGRKAGEEEDEAETSEAREGEEGVV